MQADMWGGPPSAQRAFIAIKAVLAEPRGAVRQARAAAGDSHEFLVDTPAAMPVQPRARRGAGSTSVPHEWLKLTVDRATLGVVSCQNVLFATAAKVPCPPLTR